MWNLLSVIITAASAYVGHAGCPGGSYDTARTGGCNSWGFENNIWVCLVHVDIPCRECPIGWESHTRTLHVGERHDVCWPCHYGEYSVGGQKHCSRCPAGYYQDQNVQKECKRCPNGKQSYYRGPYAKGCVDCSHGKYRDASTSSCVPCPAGAASGTGAIECDMCAAGEFIDVSACTSCPAGKWSDTPSSTCKDCPEGKSTSAEGSTTDTCTTCLAGKFAESGSPCTDCPGGKWSDSTGAISEDTCKDCNAGKFADPGLAACEPCPGGKASLSGAAICETCGIGKYSQGLTYATKSSGESCDQYIETEEDCRAAADSMFGYTYHGHVTSYSSYYAPKCIAFPSAVYWNAGGEGGCGTSGGDCVCRGVSDCKTCGVGRYTDQPDMASCKNCQPGQYLNLIGGNFCYDCPLGKHTGHTSGHSSCTSCPTGYYADVTGLIECKQCSIGRWADQGWNECTDVPISDLAQILKPPANETTVYEFTTGTCNTPLTFQECGEYASTIGRTLQKWPNNVNLPYGCFLYWDSVYWAADGARELCDHSAGLKCVCKRPKCEPPLILYEVSDSPCAEDSYMESEEECGTVARLQGESFYGSYSHTSYPPGCYRSMYTWIFNPAANAVGQCQEFRSCACKVSRDVSMQDLKNACHTVDGCWWHEGEGKCTEGCDKWHNFDTGECHVETEIASLEDSALLDELANRQTC